MRYTLRLQIFSYYESKQASKQKEQAIKMKAPYLKKHEMYQNTYPT